ncbi:MAG: multidrug effflux MFS transporter [Alphaproteobacteria bacterium]|nr:multidrug effflux MFS transporter [Alphaproteobacteria bacterium]
MSRPGSPLFLFVLVALTALGPMSMQIFLPALPAIRNEFAVTGAAAQATLSVSMLAIALSTLVYGPLSDRFGRRPIIIFGLVVYLVGSVMCAVAPDIWVLVSGRALQGAGGASGMVLARAIVRDVYSRERSAAVIAYLTTAMAVAPMAAPAIGGVLTEFVSWRANFAFVGLIGLAIGVLVLVRLTETHTEREREFGFGGMLRGFGCLLAQPIFCGYAFNAAFSLSVFFAFISGAPYVMVDILHRPASEYGFYFILTAIGFMSGSFVAARISERMGIDRMILAGSTLSLVTVVGTAGLLAAGLWHPLTLFGPASVAAFATGLSMPNAQAGAISVNPKAAGTASGLLGFIQMAVGAGVAQTVGTIHDGTPYPMIAVMLACAGLGLAAIALPLWYHWRTGRAAT